MDTNLTLLTDLYQLTMMNGYYKSGTHNRLAVFDLFFRQNGQINYAVAAGLEQAIDYINNLKFSKEDIAYLKSLKLFEQGFLDCLKDFRFSGDVFAVEEGTFVFPDEPILIVKAKVLEAQLLESALLNIINHQTLIATKTSNIVFAAGGAKVVEFGLRRAQGPDAALFGTRAAAIGGVEGTSNVAAAMRFGLQPKGTLAHSFVMSYASEYEAFEAFAATYPDQCLLIVDTYDTLKSGVPNAIKIFDNLKQKGHKPLGIRLDSGDLAYLSKKARQMLDAAGHTDTIIMASGDIDENVIASLKLQGAAIDCYGVGTKLITGDKVSSLGGVYKMSAFENANGELEPKMKISNSQFKTTNPGFKHLYRIFDKHTSKAFADVLTLEGEKLSKPLTLVHPYERWKKTVLDDYDFKSLLLPIFQKGKQVYRQLSLDQITKFAAREKSYFWDEYKRQVNPHIYKVDLSDKLYELKQQFLSKL